MNYSRKSSGIFLVTVIVLFFQWPIIRATTLLFHLKKLNRCFLCIASSFFLLLNTALNCTRTPATKEIKPRYLLSSIGSDSTSLRYNIKDALGHGHAFVRSPLLRSVSAFAAQKEGKKKVQLFEAVFQYIGLDQRSVFEINFRILNHRRSVLSSVSRPFSCIALQWKCLCIKVKH